MNRRDFTRVMAVGALSTVTGSRTALAHELLQDPFELRYILASSMYGTAPLADVLDQVHQVGARAIDIWPRRHANHREQLDELGHDHVRQLLLQKNVKLAVSTRYDLGPYKLRDEIRFLKSFDGELVICGAVPRRDGSLKKQVVRFVESMRPHVEFAAKHGITIGIENHAHMVLHSLDAIRWFADAVDFPNFGLALAPYHLPQDAAQIANTILSLKKRLVFFQAWQHGLGSGDGLLPDQQLQQLPGRGPLDFAPILIALRKISFMGWTEIFMHPFPRGTAIRPSIAEVTAEINLARSYVDGCLQRIDAAELPTK